LKQFIYECDTPQYKRKNNPSAWCEIEKATGKMFQSYPSFSFIPGTKSDEEPVRYGDFVIDIDTKEIACQDSIKIIQWFDDVYGVDEDQWRIYLSGKKGVHLELPSKILGTESGHKLLTMGYKRLAIEIESELGVTLDISMYNKGTGKPYRQANVMRKSGTCKRQIEHNDLFEIQTEEEYRNACSTPGKIWETNNVEKNKSLASIVFAYLVEAVKAETILKQTTPLSDDERDRLALNTPQCIINISQNSTPTKATFNDVAMQLSAYAISSGVSEKKFLDNCDHFISGYPSASLNTKEKRVENCIARYRTMKANGNQFSCGGVLSLGFSGFSCDGCQHKKNITSALSIDPEE